MRFHNLAWLCSTTLFTVPHSNALTFPRPIHQPHYSEEVYDKLKKAKAELKTQEAAAYRDADKAVEAKDRGNEAFKAGDFPKAVAEYSEAIKRDPDNPTYYANRAAARTKLMDCSSALEDCDKVGVLFGGGGQ